MIPPVDVTYLGSLFPELAATPAPVVEALNTVGLLYVDENVFGAAARYALALVIAHNIKLNDLRGGGAVTSKRVGDMAISQASKAISTTWDTTTYGQRFEDLCRMNVIPMRFIPPAGALPAAPFSVVASTARTPQGG